MLRRSAIRYRIYPTPAQETVFRQIAGACRFVYNLALEQREKFSRR
ncbi:MAG: helix-turn-helix domain-containing protein, partial [Tagaea sp.]